MIQLIFVTAKFNQQNSWGFIIEIPIMFSLTSLLVYPEKRSILAGTLECTSLCGDIENGTAL